MSWSVLAAWMRSTVRRSSTLALVVGLAGTCAFAIAVRDADASTLHFEIAQPNGVNQFSGYNYLCPDCTIESYAAMVLPTGYAKRNTRLLLPTSTGGFPATPPPGISMALDFVPSIPGDDFFFCCEIVNGSFLGLNAGVLLTTALVKRTNVFTYAAGDVVHDVIDTLGNRYALFLIDIALAETHDPAELDSLADLPLPPDWSYESRVLTEPLEVGTGESGLSSNFGQVALGAGVMTAWQFYVVPEPDTVLLLAGGLVGIGLAGRSRRGSR